MWLLKLQKDILPLYMFNFAGDAGTNSVLVCKKISFGKKTMNSSLVTCTMIRKWCHYTECF